MEKLSMDRGWKFHEGDIPMPEIHTHTTCYMAAKAGGAIGPASVDYDYSSWENVNLPHDWAVENPFEERWGPANGYKARGKGWYSKRFRLDEKYSGKQILLEFGGVASHCTVYLNGSVIGRNFGGYNSFVVDATDMMLFGDRLNTLAVSVDATVIEGWWYEGAGIYRHVDMYISEQLHIAHRGIFVHPELLCPGTWDTKTETDIENYTSEKKHITLKSVVVDLEGVIFGQAQTEADIESGESIKLIQSVLSYGVELWDIDSPNLYTMVSSLYEGDELVEERRTSFGYRTISIDKDNGFFLNGRRVNLYGTCNHQDHAGVGVAVPDSIQEYRIKLLKEMGSNAYRCAHGNPAPEILDACDKYGILVMDENRNFNSSDDGLKQVRDMVMRDRNHPSVIMYSIFNEEPLQGTPIGRKLAVRLDREIKSYDNTRFTLGAMNNGVTSEDGAFNVLDMTGFNYITHTYDDFRERFPNMPMIGSENDSAFQVRGEYRTDHSRNIIDCYDSECASWGNTYRDGFKQVDIRKHMMGLFIWTGFDYRGEPTPFEWPSIGTFFGIMDTCGFKKDAFYLNKAFFTEEPMIHALPHWNWEKGEKVRIMTHTNCEEAEVFINGKSIGKKPVDKYDMTDWYTEFESGTLRMVGYRDGKAVCEDEVKTAGKAVRLIAELSKPNVTDCSDDAVAVNVSAVDENGIFVPTADMLVKFSVSGGYVIGVGNGNPNSHEEDKASERKLFNGRCQAIVQEIDGAEKLVITASADGLESAETEVEIVRNTDKKYIDSVNEVYIGGWRINSEIFDEKPSADIEIADSDMNNWVSADIGYADMFTNKTGYALYRAKTVIPQDSQEILFRQVHGSEVEIYVNGELKAQRKARWGAKISIGGIEPGETEITVIISSKEAADGAGITAPVVIV